MKKWEKYWRRNWMKLAYVPGLGGLARRMAALGMPPLYGKVPLAGLNERGYISPSARLRHRKLSLGRKCYIGDGVLILQDVEGRGLSLGNRVQIHENCNVQTGLGGAAVIGDGSAIQPRCQISAYGGEVRIGKGVDLAPNCAIYSYNHRIVAGTPIREQPIVSTGGVVIEDGAWVGFGVTLLDGAHVGRGAVIVAGSVVNSAIPPDSIAAGAPARVVGYRPDPESASSAGNMAAKTGESHH
jgi:acetyltransferase-like isoleucine patch superfamily enzyme